MTTQPTNQWQPIETAPKDGARILLMVEGSVIEGYYDNDPLYRREDDKWRVVSLSSHGCGCCSWYGDLPTHWMPLPLPPEEI